MIDGKHRATVEQILHHGKNVEWRDVRSLLEAVGTVEERPNGKLEVTVGHERAVLEPPRGKDLDEQQLVDIRRLLRGAEIIP